LVKFEGLCCVCFEPIRRGEGFQFSEDGRKFHRLCVETFPFSHYVKLERKRNWDIHTSGQSFSAGGDPKTTAELKQRSAFAGWDFEEVWAIEEGVSYPYLRFLLGLS